MEAVFVASLLTELLFDTAHVATVGAKDWAPVNDLWDFYSRPEAEGADFETDLSRVFGVRDALDAGGLAVSSAARQGSDEPGEAYPPPPTEGNG